MVDADEVSRSLRGAAAFLNREPGALGLFEVSVASFWRSFGAVGLTAPAAVVELALLRHRLGLPSAGLLDDPLLAGLVLAGHLASFLALPAVIGGVARRAGLGARYPAFAIVTNWIAAFASYGLAVPGALLLLGLETEELTALFTAAFTAVVLFCQWQATQATLGLGPARAALAGGLGFGLSTAAWGLVQALAAGSLG